CTDPAMRQVALDPTVVSPGAIWARRLGAVDLPSNTRSAGEEPDAIMHPCRRQPDDPAMQPDRGTADGQGRGVVNPNSSVLPAPTAPLVGPRLKTPRAAAVAGILFSILLIASLWLLRLSVPA